MKMVASMFFITDAEHKQKKVVKAASFEDLILQGLNEYKIMMGIFKPNHLCDTVMLGHSMSLLTYWHY